MSSMPWIKIYTDILDDHKLGRLTATDKWRFVALCVLAGECDAEGYLANGNANMSIDDIAWRLREDADQLSISMQTLESVGLLCQDEDASWFVVNFSKRQGRSQSEKREQWRERKQRQRDKENVTRDSPVTPGSREEKSREEERESRVDIVGKPTIDDPPPPPLARKLTRGQRYFLDAFGAKRFRTKAQGAAVLALEQDHGTDVLYQGIDWAAKQGMNMGKAVISLETALPKWGNKRKPGDVIVIGQH